MSVPFNAGQPIVTRAPFLPVAGGQVVADRIIVPGVLMLSNTCLTGRDPIVFKPPSLSIQTSLIRNNAVTLKVFIYYHVKQMPHS